MLLRRSLHRLLPKGSRVGTAIIEIKYIKQIEKVPKLVLCYLSLDCDRLRDRLRDDVELDSDLERLRRREDLVTRGERRRRRAAEVLLSGLLLRDLLEVGGDGRDFYLKDKVKLKLYKKYYNIYYITVG